jgi:hypothetical protein
MEVVETWAEASWNRQLKKAATNPQTNYNIDVSLVQQCWQRSLPQ